MVMDGWLKKPVGPPENNNQQNLMPSDAACQGRRSSVEKKKDVVAPQIK